MASLIRLFINVPESKRASVIIPSILAVRSAGRSSYPRECSSTADRGKQAPNSV